MRTEFNNGYMSDKELAEYFSVGRSSIWAYVKSGRLEPPLRISTKSVRWSAEQVKKFEEQLKNEFDQ